MELAPSRFGVWGIRIVAALGIVGALLGLAYNASTLAFSRAVFDATDTASKFGPHVATAFYALSASCVALYLLLLASGVQLWRGRLGWWRVLAAVSILEVVLWYAAGAMWRHPEWGKSVASATGISMGGMTAQFLLLFPFWAPVVLWLSVRSRLRPAA